MDIDRIELLELAEDAGLVVHADYSGRGMFGRLCVGVVGAPQDLVKFITDVVQVREWRSDSAWLSFKTDNMGLDMIYYWPGVQAVYKD